MEKKVLTPDGKHLMALPSAASSADYCEEKKHEHKLSVSFQSGTPYSIEQLAVKIMDALYDGTSTTVVGTLDEPASAQAPPTDKENLHGIDWMIEVVNANIREYGWLTRNCKVSGDNFKKWEEGWAENKELLLYLQEQKAKQALQDTVTNLTAQAPPTESGDEREWQNEIDAAKESRNGYNRGSDGYNWHSAQIAILESLQQRYFITRKNNPK